MGRSSSDLSRDGEAGEMIDHESLKTVSAHVLMIPYPAQPHILPMLDLAHQLTRCGDITLTLVSFQVLIDRLLKEKSKKESRNDAIHLVGVPDDLPGYNPPSDLSTNLVVLRESLQLGHNMEPFVQRLLQDREILGLRGPTCLVVDFIHWWSIDVAARLSIPRYVLVVNPACHLLVTLSCLGSGYKHLEDNSSVIHVPGLPPLSQQHLPMSCRKGVQAPFKSRWPKSILESAGLLSNTCVALESQVIDTLRTTVLENKPLFPVGPLGMSLAMNVSMEGLQLSDEAGVKKWLDQQPQLSVLFVSFGTTGMLKLAKRHVLELARGLEASQQRFVWVLRGPPGVDDTAELLPPGFEKRVEGRGLLLRGWAPQLQILSHPSTGGFLSSCGWNSAVESLSRGVPIIGWPSFADQPIICRYLEGVVRVAIALPQQADHFVEAKEIEKVVRLVLQSVEGRAMRERAGKYKTSITAAVAEGGSSRQAMQEFATLIRILPTST